LVVNIILGIAPDLFERVFRHLASGLKQLPLLVFLTDKIYKIRYLSEIVRWQQPVLDRTP